MRSDYITLTDALGHFPPGTRLAYLRQCAGRGVTARNGQVIRLETLRLGKRYWTTLAWIEAFKAAKRAADACVVMA